MTIQRTAARGYPFPEVTDKPLVATRDIKDLANAIDTDMSGVSATAEHADALAAEALEAAESAGSPLTRLIVPSPTPPADTRVLWIDTSEDTSGPGVDPDPEPGPNGEGYVGALTSMSPYTTLTVAGIDDAYEMIGYDLTASGGGKSVTTRLQGPFVAGTPGVDSFQRIEEITLGNGYQIAPRSNLEFAFQLYENTAATTGPQFVPYHGTVTAVAARAVQYRNLAGDPVTMPGIGGTLSLPNGLVVDQSVYGKHPSAPANQVRIDSRTIFHPDGMIAFEAVWTALVDVKVESVYAPMTPYPQGDFTQLEHAGGTVALDTSVPTATTNQDLPSTINGGVLTSASRPGVRVAWAWTNPDTTLRRGASDAKTTGSIAFVQRRTDAINKVYRHVFNPKVVVPAGRTWSLGAQWRYMEVK